MAMCEAKPEAKVALKVHPGARRNLIVKVTLDLVDIKVAAPANKGKANAELVCFLAEALGVSKSAISIVRGKFSRDKLVAISGLTREDAVARLSGQAPTKTTARQPTLLPHD